MLLGKADVGVKYLAQYFGDSFEKQPERSVEEQVLDSRLVCIPFSCLSCSIAENAMHEEEFSSYKFLCITIRDRDVVYGIFM
ncbi:unnamed protein product [Bursaphelenchus xylophilus]|uniref:(pine wood nematode) hypothetical protein n=1 Tax=Bursaphelenchus xylophilus TaxID=6326 RepID=A0A7I8XE44_BURXY|nr:unnamed protein product [Bursaphelenchus xylophilus]CAG9113240.1 unnamed protein product [Bursaphelenchus xylophilus]